MFNFHLKLVEKELEKGFNNYKGKTLKFIEFKASNILWVRVNGTNSTYELDNASDIDKVVECLKKEVDKL